MKALSVLIIVLMVSACSSKGPKAVDKLYYRFPIVTQAPVNQNFKVERPSAMGILGNRPMVVQDANGGLTQMNHSFWLDSPKILLHNYLNKVFTYTQDSQTNTLLTQIISLEKKGLSSILAIKFTIVDSNKKHIYEKTYHAQEALSHNDIPAFVKSISSSLVKLVQQFVNDVQ